MRTRSLIAKMIAVSIAGVAMACLRFEQYRCAGDSDCNAYADGNCESMHSCSYADTDCASGRRWSEHAIKSAGKCMEVSSGETDATASASEVASSGDESSTTDN